MRNDNALRDVSWLFNTRVEQFDYFAGRKAAYDRASVVGHILAFAEAGATAIDYNDPHARHLVNERSVLQVTAEEGHADHFHVDLKPRDPLPGQAEVNLIDDGLRALATYARTLDGEALYGRSVPLVGNQLRNIASLGDVFDKLAGELVFQFDSMSGLESRLRAMESNSALTGIRTFDIVPNQPTDNRSEISFGFETVRSGEVQLDVRPPELRGAGFRTDDQVFALDVNIQARLTIGYDKGSHEFYLSTDALDDSSGQETNEITITVEQTELIAQANSTMGFLNYALSDFLATFKYESGLNLRSDSR